MLFILMKLASAAAAPSALMVECAAAGLLLRRWRLGRVLLVAGIAGLVAVMLLPVDIWAMRPLEDRFPPVVAMPARLDGIIVLGGSIDELTSQDRGTPIIAGAANRLTTFAILAQRYKQARLVFTGGSGRIEQGTATEAEFARRLLVDLGVPEGRMVFEDRSRTTAENAADTMALVHPQPGETWALVTSPWHMPRSVGVFRKAGWTVLPWPTGYVTKQHGMSWSLAYGLKLATLDLAVHEWQGLLAYWMMGKTDALLPAP